MRKKYLRFEQMEVFRPMPVTESMKEKIRRESEKAKQLAASIDKPKLPIGSKQ